MGLISAGTTTQLAIDSTQADIIKGLGFGESLEMLILTALLAIIIIICGFFIIYTVYFRFLKILIIVPLGAIACSTMAGNRMVSHTMATYCKYFLSCVFEAVTMALRFVTNTASGMGLIKCGSVVIPFDNQISKDTDLYRLYNTNIHEKIAEQKKKEAMLQ